MEACTTFCELGIGRTFQTSSYISGYTAKVAGTEVGVKEPSATFSSCFGGPFLVWHPSKYAELLAAKMKQHGTRVWLVNTGWSGGAYGSDGLHSPAD